MAASPGQPQGGLIACRNLQDPRCSVGGEASDASTSESIGAGQIIVEVGGRHGAFVVPPLAVGISGNSSG
jgi:hypothetical protein